MVYVQVPAAPRSNSSLSRKNITAIIVAALAFLTPASPAQTPGFEPRSLKGTVAGPMTQVLVLGSPHLSQMSDTLDLEAIEPLLDRLARFRPEIITIEALSGEACEILLRDTAKYPGAASSYCGPTDIALKSTGFSVSAARERQEALLQSWPSAPTAAQRRQLASVFLAANDRASALVQWLRLPSSERHSGDGVDLELLRLLNELLLKRNENYQIGATLAARLGLERVYPVDDHTADSLIDKLGPDYEAAIQAVWNTPNPQADTYKAKQATIKSGDQMLAYYRLLNQPGTLRFWVQSDFGAALRQNTPKQFGRQYVAWWETRNLRMVANVRAAFGNYPGARVLTIVGSSHKPYFDAYLNLMDDVTVKDAEEALR